MPTKFPTIDELYDGYTIKVTSKYSIIFHRQNKRFYSATLYEDSDFCISYSSIESNEDIEKAVKYLTGEVARNMEEVKKFDNVNQPKHYASGDIECIDAMLSAFGKEKVQHFCKINAFKYIWRADKKNHIEDIKKAIWYLNKYVELSGDK